MSSRTNRRPVIKSTASNLLTDSWDEFGAASFSLLFSGYIFVQWFSCIAFYCIVVLVYNNINNMCYMRATWKQCHDIMDQQPTILLGVVVKLKPFWMCPFRLTGRFDFCQGEAARFCPLSRQEASMTVCRLNNKHIQVLIMLFNHASAISNHGPHMVRFLPMRFLPVRPSEASVGILRRCCSRGHIRLRAPYGLTWLYTYGLVEWFAGLHACQVQYAGRGIVRARHGNLQCILL